MGHPHGVALAVSDTHFNRAGTLDGSRGLGLGLGVGLKCGVLVVRHTAFGCTHLGCYAGGVMGQCIVAMRENHESEERGVGRRVLLLSAKPDCYHEIGVTGTEFSFCGVTEDVNESQ